MKTEYDDDTRYNVRISPFDDRPLFARVDVQKPFTGYDGTHENDALISWSAIGAVVPDEAEMYANAILEAVKIGRRLNAEHDPIRGGEEGTRAVGGI